MFSNVNPRKKDGKKLWNTRFEKKKQKKKGKKKQWNTYIKSYPSNVEKESHQILGDLRTRLVNDLGSPLL